MPHVGSLWYIPMYLTRRKVEIMTIRSIRRCSGFSLVELMIAVFISLLLTAAVISLFASSKKSYTESERFARLGENARYGLFVLEQDLRLVNFFGDVLAADVLKDPGLTALTGGNDCTGDAAAYNVTRSLVGTMSDASGHAYGCITDAVPNTDVLVVKHVRARPLIDGNDDGDIKDAADGMDVDDDGNVDVSEPIDKNKTYVMANNFVAYLFNGGAANHPTITTGGKVPDGKAWEYQAHVYYIRDTNPPSLSRKTLQMVGGSMKMVTEEIAMGVENMRVLYGIQTQFVDYSKVTDWDSVGSVQLSLLVRSEESDPFFTDSKTYNLADLAPYSPADGFHRTVVQTTTTLRNPQFTIQGKL